MEYEYKEVDFATYCKTCKFKDVKDVLDPCNECLGSPTNLHSGKPINYQEERKSK